MSWDFPTPEQRRKAGPLVEVMHYAAIELPKREPRVRFKVWHGRRGLRCWFDTLEGAKAQADAFFKATGCVVRIEEVRR